MAPPAPPSSAPRIACLRVAALPLAAARRAHPELAGRPLAIASGTEPRAEVVAVSPEAAARGVRPGQTVARARAACAGLRVRAGAPALERGAREALLDAALGTSPRAEPAPPAGGPFAAEAAVFVDARGVQALFRSEAGFAGALAARARRVGLPTTVAVAATRGVARIAARRLAARGEETHIVAPGGDAAFLAPLPLDLLDPPDALAETFTRFGLRRVGDLLALPERGLVARLGRAVVPLLALARGEEATPPPSAPPPRELEEAQDLEAPVDRLPPLLFVLRGLLGRLADRLGARGLAMATLRLRLALDGGGRDDRQVGMAAPSLEVRAWLRLVGLALETRPPDAPVLHLAVATSGVPVRGDQLDFFRPAGPAPAVLSRTLAELTALCGAGRVGAPAVADTHRPDAFALRPFRPPDTRGDPRPRPPAASGALALRALRPPVPARVQRRRGVPARVRSALANGEVVGCAGPWRTTGHWWSEEERFAFDHWDVQTADGFVVRLRFDHRARRWEIDAVYD